MVANSRLGKGLGIPITVVGMVQLFIVFLTCSSCFLFQTNEKGQVVTKTALLKQMEELIEEPGLTCCICREGYKFQVRCNTFAKHSHHLWALSIQLHRTRCIGSGRSGSPRLGSWGPKVVGMWKCVSRESWKKNVLSVSFWER